ncbi:MAG: TIM barrel protein [Kiritimatiellae bacterium]|nr:TIM barrel protein [Kiritimatiellia bacterium]
MNISRRSFLGAAGAAGASIAMPGCCCFDCCCGSKAQVALQLYSIRTYIGGKKDKSGKEFVKGKGMAQALKDVAALGYKGVEFAGYYNHTPEELKAMLADAGLVVCGTHVSNDKYGFDTKAGTFNPDVLKKTCEFELAYGNSLIICPGGGNIPPGATWSTGRGGEPCKPSQAIDDFTKKLVELYNKAAEVAKKEGCKIGLHNHTWEHGV